MDIPVDDIAGCRAAHDRLSNVIAGLADDVARQASRLPAWSIGHVLTHLARNAEAMCRRIEAATRGAIVEQYEGGEAGRAVEIGAGAGRSAGHLVSDVISWAARLDETFGSLPPDCWSLSVRTVRGGEHPVALLPFRRWREVEVHLIDLGLGATPEDWSAEFVERVLPRLLAGLPGRSDQRALVAWMFGRGPVPNLESWG